MRVHAALLSALYSSAVFIGQTRADDDTEDASSSSVSESTTTSQIEKPTFTVSIDRLSLA